MTMTVPDRLELAGLYDWLSHDTRIARVATLSMASSGRVSGEQGALDVIDIVLKDVTGIASLAVSIASWRLARRRDVAVTFRRGGTEITADAADPEGVEKVIRDLPPDDDNDGTTPARR
jgi:hypothetical protein